MSIVNTTKIKTILEHSLHSPALSRLLTLRFHVQSSDLAVESRVVKITVLIDADWFVMNCR